MNYLRCDVTIDFKGGKLNIVDSIPEIEFKDDNERGLFITQYFGIWRVLVGKVHELKAKKVLEFGTREGFSTRLFSLALEDGEIITVDMNPPVYPDYLNKPNIKCVQCDVMDLDWGSPVDILYIDDWHDPFHLYYELNRFAKFARCVMIHDVSLELGHPKDLLKVVNEWCKQNMAIMTYYPMNACGLAIIEIEESKKCFS